MYKSTTEQFGVEITHPHNDQYLPCRCILSPNLYDSIEKLCEPSKKGHKMPTGGHFCLCSSN